MHVQATALPLGCRGERPVVFTTESEAVASKIADYIVGATAQGTNVYCTWDSAWIAARLLDLPEPELPVATPVAVPGIDEYRALGLDHKLRDYQKAAVRWCLRRTYGIVADPMRSGKTLTLIAAAIAAGSRRTIIACPAIAKWVWADEIAKWTGQQALILEGRGGDTARLVCRRCWGAAQVDGARCPDCKSRSGASLGTHIYRSAASAEEQLFRTTGKPPSGRARLQMQVYRALQKLEQRAAPTIEELVRATGLAQAQVVSALSRLEQAGSTIRVLREVALPDVHDAIEGARWVVVNYDILTAQEEDDPLGRSAPARADLPGWVNDLLEHSYDVAIGDECHLLRGRPSTAKRRGKTRRERFRDLVAPIPRVWLASGTPVYGFTRDLWGQLDACSGGLWGTRGLDDEWCAFDRAFCDGHQGTYGWEARGRSPRADNELRRRLRGTSSVPEDAPLLLKRPRSLILAGMPKKQRQVVRIDGSDYAARIGWMVSEGSGFKSAADLTFEKKLDVLVEALCAEMAEGRKAVAFTYHRAHCEKLAEALRKAMEGRVHGPAMRRNSAEVWRAHGEEADQVRVALAKGFKAHHGAGVFVATIDGVRESISLFGAETVHFVDLHWSPSALMQAEDRPYEPGVTGLTVIYYVVKGSVDEHVLSVVLPKVEHLQRLLDDQQADEMSLALREEEESRTLEEVKARIASIMSDEEVEDAV